MNAVTQTAIAAEEADEERTKRQFVGLIASALGVDQNYVGEDGRAVSPTGRFIIANPDGTWSELGQPVSSSQGIAQPAAAGLVITPGMLLIVAAALLLLR